MFRMIVNQQLQIKILIDHSKRLEDLTQHVTLMCFSGIAPLSTSAIEHLDETYLQKQKQNWSRKHCMVPFACLKSYCL